MTDPTASTDSTVLLARGVHKTYASGAREVAAVRGVDLTVAAGEWVAIMGPSGCGKSTLLHLLGGLDRPDAGDVVVAGRPMTGRSESERAVLRRRAVGYVFQAYNLVPDITAVENVELAAQLGGAGRREARRRATTLLDDLGLGDIGRAMPAELSGGQQQRVALARALVNDPAVLLADEPTGALDSTAAVTVLELLRRRHAAGQAIVLVTHDHRVAAVADRVIVMADGEVVDERRLDAATPSALAGLLSFESA